jgi:hypothetical protein
VVAVAADAVATAAGAGVLLDDGHAQPGLGQTNGRADAADAGADDDYVLLCHDKTSEE